jgi:hypothetical protein
MPIWGPVPAPIDTRVVALNLPEVPEQGASPFLTGGFPPRNPYETVTCLALSTDALVRLDERFHETALLQLWSSGRKPWLFRRPHMIRTLEAPD